MSLPNVESPQSWIVATLADRKIEWSEREISLLERALIGTSPEYRQDILLSLLNVGATPTNELYLLIAMFGLVKQVGYEIPRDINSARIEFSAFVERTVDCVAEQKENIDTLTLAVQRVMESVSERLREQAINLANDYISAAFAAKEAEIRRMISTSIGDEVRGSLGTALSDNAEIINQLRRDMSQVKALGGTASTGGVVKVPVPVRFVASGGLAVNPKSFLPVVVAACLSLLAGVELGHAFPKPDTLRSASYGKAVLAHRPTMPTPIRGWLDSHVRLPG